MRAEGNGARVYHSTADPMKQTGKRGFSEASLTTRVQRYFEANPGEWLTWEDACTAASRRSRARWTTCASRAG